MGSGVKGNSKDCSAGRENGRRGAEGHETCHALRAVKQRATGASHVEEHSVRGEIPGAGRTDRLGGKKGAAKLL